MRIARTLAADHPRKHVVGRVAAVRVANLLGELGALRGRHRTLEPEVTDPGRAVGGAIGVAVHDELERAGGDVGRDDRKARVDDGAEHRLVELPSRPTAVVPLDGVAELFDRAVRLDLTVVDRSGVIGREHLEGHGRLDSGSDEQRDHPRLQEMIVGIVVLLAEQDEARADEPRGKLLLREKRVARHVVDATDEAVGGRRGRRLRRTAAVAGQHREQQSDREVARERLDA